MQKSVTGKFDLTYTLARWGLGLVFVYSGTVKLFDAQSFGIIIDAYGLLPDGFVMYAAVFLAGLELLAGLGLMCDIKGSLAVIAGLLVLFVTLLGYGILLGLDIDCGCFGPEDPEGNAFHGLRTALSRDVLMIAVAVFLYIWRRIKKIDPAGFKSFIKNIEKGGFRMRFGKSFFTVFFLSALLLSLSTPSKAFLDNKFEKEVEKEKAAVKLVQEVQRGGYDVVTAAELKKWIDEKKDMLIIDTMPYEASYKKNHVPSAKQFLFPIPEMQKWNAAETGGKTKQDYKALLGPEINRAIVVYCGFVKCTRSHNGAMWAKKLGYKNVYRFPGGIFAWKGAKYPEEKVK